MINEEDEIEPWLECLNTLATEAHGLRDFRVQMYADRATLGAQEWINIGLGDNLKFVRALGKIRGLDRLTIEEYYASCWPTYLKEMNIEIVAHREFPNATCNGDGLTIHREVIPDRTEKELETFLSYQTAIEDVMP
jgi:hypothetical protein